MAERPFPPPVASAFLPSNTIGPHRESIQPGTPLLLGDSCPGPARTSPHNPRTLRRFWPFRAHLGLAVLSRPPRTSASTSGFPLGGPPPSLPGPGHGGPSPLSSASCSPWRRELSQRPSPAYQRPPAAPQVAQPLLSPPTLAGQLLCDLDSREERLPSFHPTATPKASTLLPSERTFDAWPLRVSLTSPSGSP